MRIAPILFHLLLLYSLFIPQTEAQVLYQAKPIMGWFQEFVKASAVDSQGNLYVSFGTSGSTGDLGVNIYDSLYQLPQGSYVAKFNSSGTTEWIHDYFGDVTSIEVDRDNAVLLSGSYQQYSFHITRINPSGEIIWRTMEGTSGGMSGRDIIIDAQGNSYVTGRALSWSIFGLTINQDGCCYDHDFLAKFNSQGNLVWIRASSPDSDTFGRSLSFDHEGNILMAGDYQGSMQMGSYALYANTHGTYLASYKPDGSINWLKGFGGDANGQCYVSDLEVDDHGSIYIGGTFGGSASFESTLLTSTAANDFDLYLAKLSDAGSLVWVKKAGSTGLDMVNDILKTADGILLSGVVSGNIEIGTATLSSITNRRSFVCRLNDAGETVWLKDLTDVPDGLWIDIRVHPHVNLHYIDDHHFYVVGDFLNSLVTARRTLIGSYWESFTAFLSDECNTVPDPGADLNIQLCMDDSIRVSVVAPELGYWTVIAGGKPTLTRLTGSDFLIDQLSPGETILHWNIEHCDDYVMREIRINRTAPEKPIVVPFPTFCREFLGTAELTTNTNTTTWYRDRLLADKIVEGPSFFPDAFGTYYVTNKIDGCEGPPSRVVVAEKTGSEPPPALNASACEGTETEIIAKGTDVRWYSDLTGGSPINQGNNYSFMASTSGQQTIYISQTLKDKCESPRAPVIVSVFATPPPPVVPSVELCRGLEGLINAEGSNLAWYTSLEQTTPDFVGSPYKGYFETAGKNTVYVTQTVNDCESEKAPLTVTVRSFSMDDVLISNVVTTNNDALNDIFYIPPFSSEDCLGEFIGIIIYNRWGRQVFSSRDRDFIWNPDSISSGTYYYSITFSFREFKGWISVQ